MRPVTSSVPLSLATLPQPQRRDELEMAASSEFFLFSRADLVGMNGEPGTIRTLMQLADMLVLLERKGRGRSRPEPVLADCHLIIADLIIRMTEAYEQRDPTFR
jgi:hypothetical protein